MLVFTLILTQISSILAFRCGSGTVHVSSRLRHSIKRTSPYANKNFHQRTSPISFAPGIHNILDFPSNSPPDTSSILLASDGESWRQYVPLVVSVGVIIDILLGSPLANLALGPMKRASQKGSGEDSDSGNMGGNSLFSAFGSDVDTGSVSKSKERVDSEAIAQAAIDKARNTLELKRYLEENKTNEQRYDDIRRKIDKQLDDLDEN